MISDLKLLIGETFAAYIENNMSKNIYPMSVEHSVINTDSLNVFRVDWLILMSRNDIIVIL